MEIDTINEMSLELQRLIDDDHTPDEIKKKAKMQQYLIELQPKQQSLRDRILANYLGNQQAYSKMLAKTQGDVLFETQLVDRDFYRRAKVFT